MYDISKLTDEQLQLLKGELLSALHHVNNALFERNYQRLKKRKPVLRSSDLAERKRKR
jgi:hypothetical protein